MVTEVESLKFWGKHLVAFLRLPGQPSSWILSVLTQYSYALNTQRWRLLPLNFSLIWVNFHANMILKCLLWVISCTWRRIFNGEHFSMGIQVPPRISVTILCGSCVSKSIFKWHSCYSIQGFVTIVPMPNCPQIGTISTMKEWDFNFPASIDSLTLPSQTWFCEIHRAMSWIDFCQRDTS